MKQNVTAPRETPAGAAGRLMEPSRWAHLTARIRRHHLDEALARGADPCTSAALAARAAALTAPDGRGELADGLERAIRAVREPRGSLHLTPRRAAVAANGDALGELTALLRADRPLYARGLAMLGMLLSDGAGPLYARRRDGALELADALRRAHAALVGAAAPARTPLGAG